jgi:hypothetical protein
MSFAVPGFANAERLPRISLGFAVMAPGILNLPQGAQIVALLWVAIAVDCPVYGSVGRTRSTGGVVETGAQIPRHSLASTEDCEG